MKVNDFMKWAKSMQDEENRLMLVKGEEYTVSDEDKFKNYVLNGKEVSEEPIVSRIQDARNYLLLLGGIIEESKSKGKKT